MTRPLNSAIASPEEKFNTLTVANTSGAGEVVSFDPEEIDEVDEISEIDDIPVLDPIIVQPLTPPA